MSNEQLAKNIVNFVGGKSNVINLVHCATRLRFTLKDESVAKTEELNAMEGVLKVIQSGGQYQVVIGTQVESVFNEIIQIIDIKKDDKRIEEQKNNNKEKKSFIAVILDVFISVMVPLVGVMSAAGILKGLLALALSMGWLIKEGGTYQLFYTIADSTFYFLPIMIGYTASKKFGMSVFTGMAIGASLLYPTISQILSQEALYTVFEGTMFSTPVYVTMFGLPVLLMNYSSTIIPAILAVFLGSKVEKFIDKRTHQLIKSFFVPLMTLIIIVPFTYLVIGPVSVLISQALGNLIVSTYNINPGIVSAILGGLWIPMVLFGVHGAITPIALSNYFTMGYDIIFPMIASHSFIVAGVVLGITLRTKDNKLKSVGYPAFVSAFLVGVIEPALYGVLLARKRLLIITCVLSSIGGAIMGFTKTTLYQLAGQGIFALPSYIVPGVQGISMNLIIAFCVKIGSFIIGLLIALMLYKENSESKLKKSEGELVS